MKNNELPQIIDDCPICTSPSRATLTAVRSSQKFSDQEMAEASGFAAEQLEEHFTHHLAGIASGDARLDAALADCGELYITALGSGNLNAAASALSVRGRLLNDMRRRKETTAKRKNLLGSASPRDPKTWQPELAAFVQQHIDWIVERVADYEATL